MADRPARSQSHSAASKQLVPKPSNELSHLRRRLNDLTRLVSDWVWEVDASLRVTSVSERVNELLGFHPRALTGKSLLAVIDPTINSALVQALSRRSPFRNIPVEIAGKDKAVHHFLFSGLPTFEESTGGFCGFRGTAEDVTRRRAAEKALERRDCILEAVGCTAHVLIGTDDWDREMGVVGAALGRASGASSLSTFEVGNGARPNDRVAHCRFTWCADEAEPATVLEKQRHIPERAFGFGAWERRLRAGEIVEASAAELPKGQRWFLAGDKAAAVLVVPIFAGGEWWGFMRFDRSESTLPWVEAEVEAIKTAADIIGATIHRHRYEQDLRASEARFATAFRTSPDAIVITRFSDRIILDVNDGFERLTGHHRDDVTGVSIAQLGLLDASPAVRPLLRGLIRDGEVRDLACAFQTKKGEARVGSLSARIVEFNGETCVLSVLRDVTNRTQADEMIRKLWSAVDQCPVLITITDTEGVIEYVNPKFVHVTGYQGDEVAGKRIDFMNSVPVADETFRGMWEQVKAGNEWRGETCNRKKNGQVFWTGQSISAVRGSDGEITHFISIAEDLTDRKVYEERLRHQANHDALTGLPNRSLFFDRLTLVMAQAQASREDWSLTLMLIDLDSFKFVNDSLGPQVGDEILRQVAQRLSRWVGPTDTIARLASDEFALVISEGGDRFYAAAIVPDILTSLAEPFNIDGHEVFLHASVGVTLYPDDGTDEYALLRNADTAMLRAKELGGNTYQFFAPGMNAKAATYITLGRDLRQALQNNELELYYQPVVEVPSRRIVGAEALLRWHHPEFGMVPPDQFIGFAEESGLIEPIGEWVLHEACRQSRVWRDRGLGAVRIAVNVSSRQLQRGKLISAIFSALSDAGTLPSALVIEITESAFLDDLEEARATLEKIHGMGIGISVDDFGTGYSSLSYLTRLPLSTLKIDRSFVRDITTIHEAAAIADAIIAMAHRLNLNVVAEGVEEENQLRFLEDKGCEMVQGFLFSPPVPADAFAELLINGLDASGSPPRLTTVAGSRAGGNGGRR